MKQIVFIAVFLISTFSTSSFANRCDHDLSPNASGGGDNSSHKKEPLLEVVPSGARDADFLRLERAAKKVFTILGPMLNYSRPNHIVEFTPAALLTLLASVGHHPAPTAHEGEEMVRNARQRLGVLEFVCQGCRSFYSSVVSYTHQLQILMHVQGHIDFYKHSRLLKGFNTDPMRESYELALMVDRFRAEYGHDEVGQWHQYLQSFVYLQDVSRGSYTPPESFKEKNLNPRFPSKDWVNPLPSKSVLQALIENFPANTPVWKVEMARTFERMVRVYTAAIPTKTMNEGWATFSHTHLGKYWDEKTDIDFVEWAELMAGVVGKGDLSNPYWLGREAWNRIYERFKVRPELKGLSQLEIDQRFTNHAHEIMGEYATDYEFLEFALDQEWVNKHKLYLKREATEKEWDHSLPQPEDPKLNQQYRVTTNYYKDVIRWIVSQVADREVYFPDIRIHNFNGQLEGKVELVHHMKKNVPLKKLTAAKTLYVLAQVWKKPISLRTELFTSAQEDRTGFYNFYGQQQKVSKRVTTYSKVPVRIEMSPRGVLKVFNLSKESGETFNARETELLQNAVSDYQEELKGFSFSVQSDSEKPDLLNAISDVTESQMPGARAIMSHAPTASGAILEYLKALEFLIPRKMKLFWEGKLKLSSNSSGVVLPMLPEIPHFENDFAAAESLKSKTSEVVRWHADGPELSTKPRSMGRTSWLYQRLRPKAGGEDQKSIADRFVSSFSDKEVLGSGDQAPDENIWGEGKGKKGGSPGEGEGEGEGEPLDGEADGNKVGGGHKKGMFIPFEFFSNFIEEYIEIPFLKPKNGKSDKKEYVRDSVKTARPGDALFAKMLGHLHALGEASLREKGEEFGVIEAVQEGLRLTPLEKYRVKSLDTDPVPEVSVVVVICRDMSGSMGGPPTELLRKVTFILKGLLQKKYKNIVIRYVGYDTEAKEYSEKDFFTSDMGGSTQYSSGIKLSRQILESYSEETYDRIFIHGGDLGDANEALSVQEYEKMHEVVQYSAFIFTKLWAGTFQGGPLYNKMQEWDKSLEHFGFSEVDPTPNGWVQVIRKLFGKDRPKKN